MGNFKVGEGETTNSTASDFQAETFEVGPWTRRKFTTSPTNVAITTATATSAELTAGLWQISSTIDTWILQGTSAVTAALTDVQLFAGQEKPMYVTGTGDTYLAGITDAGSGTLCIAPLE
jgi:hypothetical protein